MHAGKKPSSANNGRRGFTIVELLIVIVVIGILVAITIVAYNGMQARATDSANTSKINMIVKSIEIYKNDSGTYPKIFISGGTGLTDPTGSWPLSNMIGINQSTILTSGASNGTPTSIIEVCSYPDSNLPSDSSKFGYCADNSSGLSCYTNNDTCTAYTLYYRSKSNGQLVTINGGS
jgi:prepilin-type N-terminal cleavage/methylation domain-containing protein